MAHKKARAVSKRLQTRSDWNPLSLINQTGQLPSFDFEWRLIGKKYRHIAKPNNAMCALHNDFKVLLIEAIEAMGPRENTRLKTLPSARACREGDNPLKNAQEHTGSEYFYITDFEEAYKNLDLESLAAIFVYIFKHEYYSGMGYGLHDLARTFLLLPEIEVDPVFQEMKSFVQIAFGGHGGKGLAFGGPLSPFVFNLYCEVFLDDRLRSYLGKFSDREQPERNFVYTRYLDDLVISRNIPINVHIRGSIRRYIGEAGFPINHMKSRVLIRSKGTVFVTKIGLRTLDPIPQGENENVVRFSKSVLVFPQKKRRRIHHIIKSFFKLSSALPGQSASYWNDNPERITGIIAEFLHFIKNVEKPTASDRKTLLLCKQFEKEAHPDLRNMRKARAKNKKIRKRK